MYACMCKYVLLRTYDVGVHKLYWYVIRKFSTEEGQTHTERKKKSVRMASLIGSKLAKVS